MRSLCCQLAQVAFALSFALLGRAAAEELLFPPMVNVISNGPQGTQSAAENPLPENSPAVQPMLEMPSPSNRPSVASSTDTSDGLLHRLDAAEQRIAELERSKEHAAPYALVEPTPYNDEFKGQLEELWEAHLEKKGSTRPTVSVFGRMHLETLAFPHATPGIGNFENPITGIDVEDRIQFRRIRLGAQGKIRQTGVYRVEFDLGNPSRSTFRDTYFGFEDLPLLQTLLIGSQKRPLGLDTWNSNQHVLFFERPLALNAFNPNYRRIGIQSYGHSDDDVLNWQYGVFELEDVKGIGRQVADRLHYSFNTRISGTPWYDEASGGRGYLHLGVSNMYASTSPVPSISGDDDDMARFSVRPELQTTNPWIDTGTILDADHFNVTGVETVLNIDSLQFQGEYMTTVVDRRSDANLNFEGGYVQVAYFLTGEYEPWDREFGRLDRPAPLEDFEIVRSQGGPLCRGGGAWQVAARWSYLSLSDKDVQGGRQENVTLGLNWYWTPYSKMMFNLVGGHIQDRAPVNGYTSGSFTGLGVRLLMDF